ncbi:MAG: hypothetical protein CMM58_07765 [Rhodospirillaceae bacterium]|nr:hypothetical protein [Rhodospirillaceae bacterium]|tara:strand:- start:584 stop:1360 length:777 start_codon:yes stop_codon:yes gene_type:complete
MTKTVVIQSFHAEPRPAVITLCIQTVFTWAKQNRYDYKFFGDEVIGILPENLRINCFGRWPMMMDLVRLLLIRKLLDQCADRVIWFDADVLIFAPQLFSVDESIPLLVGREIWVSRTKKQTWKTRRHVHNAVLSFKNETPVLDFLIYASERIVKRLISRPSPQVLGPKLFSHLHNLVDFPVLETAGMVSPYVMADLLLGDGPALTCHLRAQKESMLAANLSHSLVGQTYDETPVTQQLLFQTAETLMKKFSKSGLNTR